MFNIPELYQYSSAVRRRFANKLAELPWEKVVENKEASFYNMRNILIHIIDNEDWIVNWAIQNRSKEYARKKSDSYTNMKLVLDHLDEVDARTKDYFLGIQGKEAAEFERRVDFILTSGKQFNLSVEEVLLQSFTEQLYHLGELIALFWQENVEPPPMQWFANNPRIKNTQQH